MTRYPVTRFLLVVGVCLGWLGALVIAVHISGDFSGFLFAGFFGMIVALVLHGFFMVGLALLDIADTVQDQRMDDKARSTSSSGPVKSQP
jgi:hypothetical protein